MAQIDIYDEQINVNITDESVSVNVSDGITVYEDGVKIGTTRALNFKTGTDIDLTVAESSNQVDVTVSLGGDISDRVDDLEDVVYSQTSFAGQAYAIWTGTGLVFDVYWPVYYIAGVRYAAGSEQVTLSAADPTNPRTDVIAIDATGAVVLTGTPAADPVKPTVDPLTQIEVTEIQIAAGATTPTGISQESIYKENVEWTATSDNGTVNFDATSNPLAGTKHIDCGAFTAGQYLRFTDSVTNDASDYSLLQIYVNLKATFATTAGFQVTFRNGTTAVSSTVSVLNGRYNFVRTTINTYQQIVIPLSAFTFTSANFNNIQITFAGTNATGFRMDNILLQVGSTTTSPLQNAITTITTDSGSAVSTQANDVFNIVGASGITVSASGKTITVTGSGGGGGGTWGSITGTLSNQTDLQTALNAKENSITAGTTSQYYRGDKTFQTLDKSAVGLGNVDNTSDANKPVSTATQTALNAKQDTLVSGTNIKTINSTSVLGSGDIVVGGTPGGLDTQVQFNDASSFGGDAGLTYNKTTNVLTAGGVIVNDETASRIAIIDASKNVKSADTTTYPSLTEIAYVKGVTSSIQTQINAIGGVDADALELAQVTAMYNYTQR